MPVEVQSLIAYRNSESEEAQALIAGGLDNVRWDLLSEAGKVPMVWAAQARRMGPQALRMNLNTLLRHDVFNVVDRSADPSFARMTGGAVNDNMVDYVADRIADESEIRRSKQFPYQYFAAYLNADDNVPQKIKTALHKAAEIACGNVPELPGPIVIGLDTSGSMSSAVTGQRVRGAFLVDNDRTIGDTAFCEPLLTRDRLVFPSLGETAFEFKWCVLPVRRTSSGAWRVVDSPRYVAIGV